MKPKILIIGLDGVSWDVIDLMISRGIMPNLKTLKEQGAYSDMESTFPPMTTVAWASILTGKNPGKHGIFGWFKYRGVNKKVVTSADIDSITFLEILEREGYKIISINIPFSKPLRLKNSIVIDHFIDIDKDFVYPGELREEIDFTGYEKAFQPAKWYHRKYHGKLFDLNTIMLKRYKRHLKNSAKVIKQLVKKKWDVFFYLISHTDWALHAAAYEVLKGLKGKRYKLATEIFRMVDELIGDLVNSAKYDFLFIISDHGFQSYEKQFHVNTLLKKENLADFGRVFKIKNLSDKFKYWILRLSQNMFLKKVLFNLFPRIDYWFLDLNLKTSKAFLLSDFEDVIYINDNRFLGLVKDKEKKEIVGKVIKSIEEAKKEFKLNIRVLPKEYVWSGRHLPEAPDICLISDEVRFSKKLTDEIVTNEILNRHNSKAIFLICGDGVEKGKKGSISVYDICPTLLHIAKCKVPLDLDGSVQKKFFSKSSEIYKREVKYKEY